MILASLGIIAGKGVVTSSLNTNLVSAYNFDNNLNDSFGTNNGTGFGGITYSTGIINQSVGFNGANTYVELPNGSGQFNFTNDFSISLWVNPSNTVGYPFLFSNYQTSGANSYGYFLYVFNDTDLRFVINNGANEGVIVINQKPTANVWTHIVITRKNSTISKMYINGVLKTPSTSTNQTLNPSYLSNVNPQLGARQGSFKYTGYIDSLDFWNKELTPTEVTELYNSGVGKQYPF